MDSDILERVNELVKKTYYTFDRFDVDATFALLYHEKSLTLNELAKFIRLSDHLLQIDANHYFIIFSFTSQKNAYKASQNILYKLDTHFNDHSSLIAMDILNPTKSPQSVLNRLKQIMTEIHKNNFVRIETEDILDR